MKKIKVFQRGSVFSIVLIIVVIILVIVGLFITTFSSFDSSRSQKGQTFTNTDQSQVVPAEAQSVNQITFREPAGLFSFIYPADLEITKHTPTNGLSVILSQYPYLVNISKKTSEGVNQFDIEVDFDESLAVNFEKASQMKGSSNFSRESVTIGGVSGYRMYYERLNFGKTVKKVLYVFPLSYNGSRVVLYEKIEAWDSTWISKVEPIAKSIKIDVTKTPEASETLKNNLVAQSMKESEAQTKLNSSDIEVKSFFTNIRTDAEISYDTNQSYSEVCTSSTNLDHVKSKITNNTKCSSGFNYYVVTTQLPSGSLYCVDSSGYVGGATAFQKGQVCAR